MGNQDFRCNPSVDAGRARPAGPAHIVMTKIGGRCPPYAAEENVPPDAPYGAPSMPQIRIG